MDVYAGKYVERKTCIHATTAVTKLAIDNLRYSQLNELTDIQRTVYKPECDGHPI